MISEGVEVNSFKFPLYYKENLELLPQTKEHLTMVIFTQVRSNQWNFSVDVLC